MSSARMASADMRQLALLVALVDVQSLSQAADRLGFTPSAASQSLQRLRESFGDELVVRHGSDYRTTPLGQTVLESFREMVRLWQEATLGASVFDPSSSEAHLRIASIEGFTRLDLDACYSAIVSMAPRVRLDVRETDAATGGYEGLYSSSTDVLLTSLPPPENASDLHAEPLPVAVLTHCCLSASHPRIGDTLSLQQYLAEHHLLASAAVSAGQASVSPIDRWLTSIGLPPRTSSVVHPRGRLAYVLSTTDRVATVSLGDGEALRRHAQGLKLVPLPPELPQAGRPYYLVWHHRTHHSPPHRWLRERLREHVLSDPVSLA